MPGAPRKCAGCDKPFTATAKKADRAARYCSDECRNVARRSRFRDSTVTPEQLAVASDLAAKGCSEITISRALGVGNREVFRALKERDPRLRAAIEGGRAVEHDALVGSLFVRAMDPKNQGGTAAAIFLLKARHGYRELSDPQEGNKVQILFSLPGALTAEQYAALAGAGRAALSSGAVIDAQEIRG
jgi:hypothetical protein